MASCDSFRQIFDTPLSENLPWNQIKSTKSLELCSFGEIFRELQFKETESSFPLSIHPPSSSSEVENDNKGDRQENPASRNDDDNKNEKKHKHSYTADGFSPNSSLQLCTEGLGFESFDDVEDVNEKRDGQKNQKHKVHSSYADHHPFRRMKSFPPPISSIGRSGKPWVSYKSFRRDGRFVLKEVRVPTQEFLQASREDGRLKMHLVLPRDEFDEDEEEESVSACEEEEEDAAAEGHKDENGEQNDELGEDKSESNSR